MISRKRTTKNTIFTPGKETNRSGKYFWKITVAFFVFFTGSLFSGHVFGQCDSDEFLDRCASNLGTYNYIKSFTVNAAQKKKSGKEYHYVFSKGSTYVIIACNETIHNGKMIISLFDRNHEEIATTRNIEEGKEFPELKYECNTTGVYYLKVSFEGTNRGCGMCILGIDHDRSN